MRLATALVALVALGFGGAFAQVGASAASADTDGDRLLSCRIRGLVPEAPGVGDQGGYAFEYQSLFGVTDDERSCTVYRLRNTPDRPPTPFRWTQGDAVVVDKARLPRCARVACDWLVFVTYFAGTVDTAPSVLSYGLNADAYRDTTQAFVGTTRVRDHEDAAAADLLASSVGTELFGTFATDDGAEVPLHLIAKSRFEPGPEGAVRLVYEIEDLAGSGALGAGSVRVAWGPLEAVGGPALRIERTANGLTLVVPAMAFALDASFTLRVYVEGEDRPVLDVPMPAYVAIGERAPRY